MTSRNATVVLLDASAARGPDHSALVAGGTRLSYGALVTLTNRAAHALRGFGCTPGARVLIALPDSAEMAAAVCAVIRIGAVAVPVGSGVEDHASIVRELGVEVVIGDDRAIDDLLRRNGGDGVTLLAVGDRRADWPADVRVWAAVVETAPAEYAPHDVELDHPALILHTSGSTGRRKAVVHTHRALRAVAHHLGAVFELGRADRVLCTARPAFAFGFGFGLAIPWAAGATAILHTGRDLRELAETLRVERPTILCGVPSLLDVLLRAGTSWLPLDLSSLRCIVSAGEPLPPAVYDGYRAHFGVEVLDGIGSTELLTHFLSNRPGRSKRGACGRPVPGFDVQLVDEDGTPVPDGAIGNLRVRSETALLEYWNAPEATARVKTAHGIATGDKLYRDADGDYHFCGRSDDMLKIAGQWVSPPDVEAALRDHPDVEQCAVTTREDHSGRRRLVAYVVARPPAVPVSDALRRHAGERLPPHMIPAAFVAVPALPRTPNGKLQRSGLPEPIWTAGRGAPA